MKAGPGRRRDHRLLGREGVAIPLRVRTPEELREARGLVIVLHGHSEHSGRYLHVLDMLADAGYVAAAPDHRGHGRSSVLRGYIEDVDTIVDDLLVVRRYLGRIYPGLPTFVWGHSMGGLLALRYLQRAQYDLSGAIIASAAARIPPRLSRVAVGMADVLAAVAPTLGIQRVSERGWSCSDPQLMAIAEEDPWVYRGRMRAKTGWALLQAMRKAVSSLPDIRLPVIVCHGGDDRVVSPSASRLVHERVASADKTLVEFPGFLHELHNDVGREQYFAVLLRWLDARARKLGRGEPTRTADPAAAQSQDFGG